MSSGSHQDQMNHSNLYHYNLLAHPHSERIRISPANTQNTVQNQSQPQIQNSNNNSDDKSKQIPQLVKLINNFLDTFHQSEGFVSEHGHINYMEEPVLSIAQRMILDIFKVKKEMQEKKQKRVEEKQKMFFKKAFKFVENQFFSQKYKKKKIQKRFKNYDEFYDFYFSDTAKQQNISLANYHHPQKTTSKSKQSGQRSFNQVYIDLILASPRFRTDVLGYLNNTFFSEIIQERDNKIEKFVQKCFKIVEDSVKQFQTVKTEEDSDVYFLYIIQDEAETMSKYTDSQKEIQNIVKESLENYILKNPKCKIPWSVAELDETQLFALRYIENFENQLMLGTMQPVINNSHNFKHNNSNFNQQPGKYKNNNQVPFPKLENKQNSYNSNFSNSEQNYGKVDQFLLQQQKSVPVKRNSTIVQNTQQFQFPQSYQQQKMNRSQSLNEFYSSHYNNNNNNNTNNQSQQMKYFEQNLNSSPNISYPPPVKHPHSNTNQNLNNIWGTTQEDIYQKEEFNDDNIIHNPHDIQQQMVNMQIQEENMNMNNENQNNTNNNQENGDLNNNNNDNNNINNKKIEECLKNEEDNEEECIQIFSNNYDHCDLDDQEFHNENEEQNREEEEEDENELELEKKQKQEENGNIYFKSFKQPAGNCQDVYKTCTYNNNSEYITNYQE